MAQQDVRRLCRMALLIATCTAGSGSSERGPSGFALPELMPARARCAGAAGAPALSACALVRESWHRAASWRRSASSLPSRLAAVAVEQRDMQNEPRRSGSGQGRAGANPKGGAESRTKALLRQQGRKWTAETRSWTETMARRDRPGGSAGDETGDRAAPIGSYVRQDLVDFLAHNPLFSASGTGTIAKTNRQPALQVRRAELTRQDTAIPNDSPAGTVSAELYTEVFDKSPLTRRPAGAPAACLQKSPEVSLAQAAPAHPTMQASLEEVAGGNVLNGKVDARPKRAESIAVMPGSVVAAQERSEAETEFEIGGDDDPLVQELLRDVFAEEAEDASMLSSSMNWESELLRDVFAQNPLTRKSSAGILMQRDGASGREGELGAAPVPSELWAAEMLDLFSQSPLTRRCDDEVGGQGGE